MNLMTIKRCGGWRLRPTAQKGIAAVEFALVLPVFMALLIGGTETTFLLMQSERVDRIAYSVTDIITQSETLTKTDLDTTFLAAAQLMQPFDFNANGVVIVSSVYKPSGGTATIKWQYAGGGALARASKIGYVGQTPSLPDNMSLNDNDNVIVSEVYYAYKPLFVNAGYLAAHDLYHVAVYKPRLSPLISTPQ